MENKDYEDGLETREEKSYNKDKHISFKIVILLLVLTNIITFGITRFGTRNYVMVPREEFKNQKKINQVKGLLDNEFLREIDEDKYLDGQIKGMVASLEDPYTQYMTEAEFTSLMDQTSGSFGGIGVIVSPGDDNLITVVSPVEDTPGERAGIKPGDKIIKVEGVEYLAENMDEAIKIMKGEVGTDVNITILRSKEDGSNEMIDLTITRDEIRTDSVKSEILEDNIGYIRLTSFDELTYDEFIQKLDEFDKKSIEGVVIDLRNNPGGLLDVCRDIADELLAEGDIVYTEDKDGNREYLKSGESSYDKPIVVLVNEGSASASEILSGAIKDHNRGKIVGTTTFGKGLVQRIHRFKDGSGIKITISEYFTPKGTKINEVGVEPDYTVELPDDIEGIGVEFIDQDTQLQKAIEILKDEM